MKLAAIAQRGSKKDFVDIYAIGGGGSGNGLAFDEMLQSYAKRYEIDELGHVLFGLTYFDDAEDEPMPDLLIKLEWEEVKNAIRDWVQDRAKPQRTSTLAARHPPLADARD